MNQVHYIDGKKVNPPRNYQELSIEIIFDNDTDQRTASITRFEWVNEEAAIIKDYFAAGLSGGLGLLEGLPHRIEIYENGQSEVLLNGYIDLTTADFSRDFVAADTTPEAQIDWINEVADGFSFEFLKAKGFLKDTDNVYVPYIISSIPNYTDAFVVVLTLTFVILELKNLVSELSAKAAESASVLGSVSGIINLIFKVIYAVLLLATIVELLLDLANFIIQRVKYHPAMSINRQIEAACQYLGLNYQSPILQGSTWSRAHIIPERYAPPEVPDDSGIRGFLQPNAREQNGYFNGTFGDLLRAVKTMFNARIVMDNATLKILPLVKTGTSGTFILPPHYKPEFRTNADRIVSNYLIDFATDSADKNTIDNWEGNNAQAILEPITTRDAKLKLLKGFTRVSIPFARGTRKESLTTVEKIADTLLEGIGPVIGALIKVGNAGINTLNRILRFVEKLAKGLRIIGIKIKVNLPQYKKLVDPRLQDLIDGRIGMLLTENDYLTTAKIVLLDVNSEPRKTKVSIDNQEKVNAEYIFNTFHSTNSFAPGINSAQRFVFTYEKVEMNLAEFKQVSSEGLAKLPTGEIVEVISCTWNPSTRLAEFTVEKKQLYTNNLKETILVPTGR